MKDNSFLYEERKEKTTLLLYEKVDFTSKFFPHSEAENSRRTVSFLRIFPLKYVETRYMLVEGKA